MDSRFAALADRYSQSAAEQGQPESHVSLITGEHDWSWSMLTDFSDRQQFSYPKVRGDDGSIYLVNHVIGFGGNTDYIVSSNEQSTLEKQTIQNTALSGDTCW